METWETSRNLNNSYGQRLMRLRKLTTKKKNCQFHDYLRNRVQYSSGAGGSAG